MKTFKTRSGNSSVKLDIEKAQLKQNIKNMSFKER